MHPPRHHSYKAIVVALALALALTLTACNKSPEQHFQQAQGLVQKADYKAAAIELKSVLQEQPNNREARLLLGGVLIKNGAYPEAEKELSKARSLGVPDDQVIPELARVYVRMGEPQKALDLGVPATGLSTQALANIQTTRAEAQMSLGKRADAEKSIVAAIQAAPKQPELLLIRAKLALMDKQKDQAGKLIDESLQQDPKLTEALYFKAALIQSENKPDDAIKVYQQILANDPNQFRAHLAISSLLQGKGDSEAAEKAIQAAEKIAGNVPMVRYARGTFELRRGKPDKASSALLDVLRVMPDHLPTALAYALASYGSGNYEQSIKNASKVLAAEPNNPIATNILAGSLLKTGDVKGALKILEPLLAKHPNDAKLLALAGEAYLQTQDYNKAMGYLDKAAELEPRNVTIKTRRAAGHLATGENDEAMADLEQAASLSDQPGEADMALVMLRLKGKQYDKALQAIANLEKKLPNNPVTHNLRATALLGKQDRAGARKALEQAIAIQPSFFLASFNLAHMDAQDKKPEAARERFKSILAQDKNNVKSMLALADLAMAEKKEKEGVDWIEKAIKADPKVLPAYAGLIRLYLGKKENAKALAQAKQAANANPESLDALDLLGTTQMSTGDNAAAISTYTKMIQKAPQLPEAHLRLASAQIASKHLAPARDSLIKALQIKADFLKAQDALIRLELVDNKPEAALRVARQIQAQQTKSPIGFEREADILLSLKRYPQAIKAYEQALSKGSGTANVIKLHRTLYIAGDTKGADQRLAGWLKQYPKDVAAHAYAAEVYMVAKRYPQAIGHYEEVLKIDPNHLLALNNLAYLYQMEKDGRAQSIAERALKLDPDHPGVQDTLGWILVENGQVARGVELLRKATDKAPNADTIRYHYALALMRTGNQRQAKQELDTLIKSKRSFPELEEAKTLLSKL